MPSEETVHVSPMEGNTDIGQRDSGYSVVSSNRGRPDTEPAISRMWEMELGHGQTSVSRGVCESALKPRGRGEGPRKKLWPRLRTGPGKTGCPGLSGGLRKRRHGGNVSPPRIERVRMVTLHLKLARWSSIPTVAVFWFVLFFYYRQYFSGIFTAKASSSS